MASMKIEHRFTVPREEARQRLEALGQYLGKKYGINFNWDGGDKASFKGKYTIVTIEGTLTLGDGKVIFDGKDPGFLWRNKAKDYIEAKLRTYLDPSRALESLPRA